MDGGTGFRVLVPGARTRRIASSDVTYGYSMLESRGPGRAVGIGCNYHNLGLHLQTAAVHTPITLRVLRSAAHRHVWRKGDPRLVAWYLWTRVWLRAGGW